MPKKEKSGMNPKAIIEEFMSVLGWSEKVQSAYNEALLEWQSYDKPAVPLKAKDYRSKFIAEMKKQDKADKAEAKAAKKAAKEKSKGEKPAKKDKKGKKKGKRGRPRKDA